MLPVTILLYHTRGFPCYSNNSFYSVSNVVPLTTKLIDVSKTTLIQLVELCLLYLRFLVLSFLTIIVINTVSGKNLNICSIYCANAS